MTPDSDASMSRAVIRPIATIPPFRAMTTLRETEAIEGAWACGGWSSACVAAATFGIAQNNASATAARSANVRNSACRGTVSKLSPLDAPASPVATLVMTWTQEIVREKSPWEVSRLRSAPEEGR